MSLMAAQPRRGTVLAMRTSEATIPRRPPSLRASQSSCASGCSAKSSLPTTPAGRGGAISRRKVSLTERVYVSETDRQSSRPATAEPRRSPTLDCAGRVVRRIPDDHPRPDDRERRAALDPERPALLTVEPGVGRERVPDRVRWPAAARRPSRGPDRTEADLLDRLDGVHLGVVAVRPGSKPDAFDRRAFRSGDRRRDDLCGDPGDDRDHVPQALRAGEGDQRLQLRRVGRSVDRPAGRWRLDPGDQLALDLLRQLPDRDRDSVLCIAAASCRQGHRPRTRGRRFRGRCCS